MDLYGIYSAGGFAREVLPIVAATVGEVREGGTLCVIDDAPPVSSVNGYPVLTYPQFLGHSGSRKFFNVAVSDPSTRKLLAERCLTDGLVPFDVISPGHLRYDQNEVGEGAILCANTIITSNATIGRFFHANIYSYVAHDCVIGDYVTFAPRVNCNGNVVIDDLAYIGTGAVIRQGRPGAPLRIGRGAVVGMGAVVTKDVPDGLTVVGNPARPLDRG